MRLMLDTNTCIALIKRKPVNALQKFNKYQVGDIGISAVTLAELRYGVSKSQHQAKNQTALDEFMLPLEVAAFDEQATGRLWGTACGAGKTGHAHRPAGYHDSRACAKFECDAGHE